MLLNADHEQAVFRLVDNYSHCDSPYLVLLSLSIELVKGRWKFKR